MLRRKKVLIALFVVALLSVVLVATVAGGGESFIGSGAWENDDRDGSNQYMWIRSMGKHSVITWFDDDASICFGYPAFILGSGQLEKDGTLTAKLKAWCMAQPVYFRKGIEESWSSDGTTLRADGFQCWDRPKTDDCSS